jgi:hypothetical protein
VGTLKRASVGVSAHLGWAATVVLACDERALRVLRSDRIETAPAGERETSEPYHVAGGFDGLSRVPRPADPEAVVRAGLRRQRRFAARAIAGLDKQLAAENYQIVFAGILVSRGCEAARFEQAIASHTQIHIQEGLAVRASLRNALRKRGAKIEDIDQKSVVAIASQELGQAENALMERLGAVRPDNGGAWRKEQKLAILAAWVAWRRRTH